jgi:hypothetical protein
MPEFREFLSPEIERKIEEMREKITEEETKEPRPETPKTPEEHSEMIKIHEEKAKKAQEAREESQRKLDEAVMRSEEVEATLPLPFRWREMHEQYLKEKEEKRKRAFEDLERIAWLENEIYQARKFLEELKREKTYDPESPAVKEAENFIAKQRSEIEEILRENPWVEKLFLEPRKRELEKMEERKRLEEELKRSERRLENLSNNLKSIAKSKGPLYMGDLITMVRQAKNYLEERDINDREVTSLIEKRPWEVLRIGNKVYLAARGIEGSKKIFRLLKEIEHRVYEDDKKRKERIAELKKEASSQRKDLEALFETKSAELLPEKVFVEMNFPLKLPNGRMVFLRGGILLERHAGKKLPYWGVKEIVGNVGELLGINEKSTFTLGLTNAPRGLKEALRKAIEMEILKEKKEEEKKEEASKESKEPERKEI